MKHIPQIPRPLDGHVTGLLVFVAVILLLLALSGCLMSTPFVLADKAFVGVGYVIESLEGSDDPNESN